MLWRTGLGSNSFTGSKKHHWGYDLRLPLPVAFLYNTLSWRKYKVPYCYGAGQQDSSGYSFAKEGWTRPKENAAKHPLIGADGVVVSSYRLFIPFGF